MIDFIGYLATALAAAQFVPQVVRTTRSGDLNGVSAGMFVIMVAQAFAWIGYGVREHLAPAIITNGMLATCGVLMVRLLVRQHAPHIRKAIAVAVLTIAGEALIFLFLPKSVLGILAAFLAFIMLWPQVITALKARDLSGLSAASWYLSIANTVLWVVYGVGKHALLLWMSAGQAAVLSLVILARMWVLGRAERARQAVFLGD